ncbi:hypothetical protein L0222_12365 [bacterium]|nr:hypothetical protein [bacterium]
MKLTIGVMGASAIATREIELLAVETGRCIARKGAVMITGATTGLPYAAARGAKEEKGEVIGFSPAINWVEHERIGYPAEFHDLIICTGLTSHGRNLLNVRASHGLVFVGGSMGALNEFTIAYDENKVIGILEGTGGFCNHLQDWMLHLNKPGNRAVLIHRKDPEKLVDDVFEAIRDRADELGL